MRLQAQASPAKVVVLSGNAPSPTLSHGHEDSTFPKDSHRIEDAQTMVVEPKDSDRVEGAQPLVAVEPSDSDHVEGAQPLALEPIAKKKPRGRPPKSLKEPSEVAKAPKRSTKEPKKAKEPCPKAKVKSSPKVKGKAKTKKARIKCWVPFILYQFIAQIENI